MDEVSKSERPDPGADSDWPLVSALFITYKRIDLLREAVRTFHEHTDYPNLEVIIADDASPLEIQEQIGALQADKKLLPTRNRGLGANINQGMAACRGEFILMIQDDWMCRGPRDYLRNCVLLFQRYATVGMISFTFTLAKVDQCEVLEDLPERAVLYPENPADRDYPFLYSDQPHLRRRSVNDLVGPYLEDRDMVKCEQDYERRWEAQTVYRTAMVPAYLGRTFTNAGTERSLRESRLQNRIDRMLLPLADLLRNYPAVFRVGKAVVRFFQRLASK